MSLMTPILTTSSEIWAAAGNAAVHPSSAAKALRPVLVISFSLFSHRWRRLSRRPRPIMNARAAMRQRAAACSSKVQRDHAEAKHAERDADRPADIEPAHLPEAVAALAVS